SLGVRAERGSDTADLVCRDRHARPGPTEHDTGVARARGDELADLSAHRCPLLDLTCARTHESDRMPAALDRRDNGVREWGPLVGPERDAHCALHPSLSLYVCAAAPRSSACTSANVRNGW